MCTSCGGYKPQTVTLQTAVIMVVKDFVGNDKSFSIHDITVGIREKCNKGLLEISEIENPDPASPFRFNVEHSSVRSLFNEMWDRGVFSGQTPILDRRHNGRYWEFSCVSDDDDMITDLLNDIATADDDLSKVSVQKSVQTYQTSYTQNPPLSMGNAKIVEAKRRIKLYLENCAKIPVFPTLKQVQSAIHRPRGLPLNLTLVEIESLVKELGLTDKTSPCK